MKPVIHKYRRDLQINEKVTVVLHDAKSIIYFKLNLNF